MLSRIHTSHRQNLKVGNNLSTVGQICCLNQAGVTMVQSGARENRPPHLKQRVYEGEGICREPLGSSEPDIVCLGLKPCKDVLLFLPPSFCIGALKQCPGQGRTKIHILNGCLLYEVMRFGDVVYLKSPGSCVSKSVPGMAYNVCHLPIW
jgi:hypothetical protein